MIDPAAYVAQKWGHLEKGDAYAPPPDREAHPTDELIAGIVAALKPSTRMYPETWAWIVTDALNEQQGESK